jgi:hypothetical protein
MRAIPIPAPDSALSLKLAEHAFSIRQIWKHGFTGDLVEGLTVASIKTKGGLQVREEKWLAPPHKVAQYKADMLNGAIFPPMIVTRDGYPVDGNTRLQAYLGLGVKTVTVFRLHVDFANATANQIKDLEELGTGMNGANGEGMKKGNIERLVKRWYAPGDTPRTLAEKIHFPEASVRRIFKIEEGRAWLARLGVTDPDYRLKGGHYEAFASWDQKMTDVILASVATLARDAKFTIPETIELGQQVIDLKSEVAKLDYIDEQSRANEDRRKGLASKPSPAGQFRQALGHVTAYLANPVLGVEPINAKDGNAEDRARTEAMLKEAQQVIDAALKEQLVINNPDAQPVTATAASSPFRFGR